MINEYNLSHRPFRPLHQGETSGLLQSVLEKNFPVIGLNGGVLIPADLVSPVEGMQEYVQSHFIPIDIGRVVGTTYFQDGEDWIMKIVRSSREVYSSRGPSYFLSNRSPDRRNIWQRSEVLKHRWNSSLLLLNSIQRYSGEVLNNRFVMGLLQNLATDLISGMYALEIARTFFEMNLPDVRPAVLEATTQYYKSLMQTDNIEIGHIDKLGSVLDIGLSNIDSVVLRAESKGVDVIRTYREADMAHLTLAGGEHFVNEWKVEKPTIILPLLGAYDLAPALKVLGYEGDIYPVLTGFKRDSGSPSTVAVRRQTEFSISGLADILSQKEGPVVLIDDSLGTGQTVDRIIKSLQERGIPVLGVRTLFETHQWQPNADEVKASYPSGFFKAYFTTPMVRQHKAGSGEHPLFQRRVHDRWTKDK